MAAAADGLDARVRRLPKVELHLHLEGAIGHEARLRLAARNGVELPATLAVPPAPRRFAGFPQFVAEYLAISRCLGSEQDFAEATESVALGLAADNVRYAEITVTPMTHVRRGVASESMVEGLLAGRHQARARHGVTLGFVFDVVRSFPDQAEPTLACLERLRSRDADAAIGLGIGGPEGPEHPTEPFVEVFRRARAGGFHSLPHAGELRGPEAVREALDLLGAERVGHGLGALADPALVERLVERGVVLEVCPSSNVALGVVPDLAAHPLPRMLAAGLRVTLATDDPALFGVGCSDEYLGCARTWGWDLTDVVTLVAAGIDASFMSPADKLELRRSLAAAAGRAVEL